MNNNIIKNDLFNTSSIPEIAIIIIATISLSKLIAKKMQGN